MILWRVDQFLAKEDTFPDEGLRSGRIGDGLDHFGEEAVEDGGHGGVSDGAGFKVIHSVLFGQRGSVGFGDGIFGGGVKIDFVSDEELEGRVGFFVDLDPFFDIFEGLSFGD